MEEYTAKSGYLYVAKDDPNIVGKKLMTSNIELFELVDEKEALANMDKIDEDVNLNK